MTAGCVLVCSGRQLVNRHGQSPLTALRLDPFPPQAVAIGPSPPCALPPPPWPVSPSLLPFPFPREVVPTEPPDRPCSTALCRVHTRRATALAGGLGGRFRARKVGADRLTPAGGWMGEWVVGGLSCWQRGLSGLPQRLRKEYRRALANERVCSSFGEGIVYVA